MTRDEEIKNVEIVSKFCKNMEPQDGVALNIITARGIEITSLASIAISLKRIADKLELSQKQPIIMTAEEAKKFGL